MKQLRVPPAIVGGKAALPAILCARGREQSLSREDALRLAELLPNELKEAPAFLDRLHCLWRYDPGTPITALPNGHIATGTHLWPEVNVLFDVLNCARHRLPPEKLSAYLTRLANPAKHQDVLYEFAPVLRVAPDVNLENEVAGFGDGNQTVDWVVRSREVNVALDVKNRVVDLIDSLGRISGEDIGADGHAPAPAHDPKLLLRGLEAKFASRAPAGFIQAGWIHTDIQQEEGEFAAAFLSLDSSRVHAVLLGDFDNDVYVIAVDEETKHRLLDVLNLRESRRFVFSRGAG